jgi:hypothetical protein
MGHRGALVDVSLYVANTRDNRSTELFLMLMRLLMTLTALFVLFVLAIIFTTLSFALLADNGVWELLFV